MSYEFSSTEKSACGVVGGGFFYSQPQETSSAIPTFVKACMPCAALNTEVPAPPIRYTGDGAGIMTDIPFRALRLRERLRLPSGLPLYFTPTHPERKRIAPACI